MKTLYLLGIALVLIGQFWSTIMKRVLENFDSECEAWLAIFENEYTNHTRKFNVCQATLCDNKTFKYNFFVLLLEKGPTIKLYSVYTVFWLDRSSQNCTEKCKATCLEWYTSKLVSYALFHVRKMFFNFLLFYFVLYHITSFTPSFINHYHKLRPYMKNIGRSY